MKKFDEMVATLPEGLVRSLPWEGQPMAGVRPHYEAYAAWLAGRTAA